MGVLWNQDHLDPPSLKPSAVSELIYQLLTAKETVTVPNRKLCFIHHRLSITFLLQVYMDWSKV